MTEISSDNYAEFLGQLKNQIRQRQYQALRAVNHELVGLYWELGQAIHQKQQELGWGKAVVQNLARDLQTEFPGRNGFSAQNLWLMQQFYREYSDSSKLQPLVREISWAKNLVILARCKDELEREFYLRATAKFGWTKSVYLVPKLWLGNAYRQALLDEAFCRIVSSDTGCWSIPHCIPKLELGNEAPG